MRQARALCVALMTTCATRAAIAETIWERAKFGDRSEERRMRASIENVLLGVGDERDLLQARVGLITLSRGDIQDPRTIVLLLRMRRELGLSTSRSSKDLLGQALKADLSLTERAWAELELGHSFLSRGELLKAQAALDRGLEVAWQTQVRAETLILRGLLGLRLGSTDRSLEDFSQVTELAASRRLLVQAYIGKGFAFALRGDAQEARVYARRAFVTEANRATVSRLDPFWDLQLSPIERDCARALLLLGRADVLSSEDPRGAHSARSDACSLLEPAESRTPELLRGSDSGERAWGEEIQRSLSGFYRHECVLPAPSDLGVIQESETPDERGSVSTPRHDEDDF